MNQPLLIAGLGLLILCLYLSWTFVVWRKWRREYEYDELLNYSLIVVVGSLAGGGVGMVTGWPWVGAAVGWFASVLVADRMVDLDTWEVADSSAVGWLVCLGLVAAVSGNAVVTVGAVFAGSVAMIVSRSFRRFMWYRSGSPGLPFLSSLGVFLILNSGIAFVMHVRLYFVPVIGVLLLLPIIYFRAIGPKQSWQKNKRRKTTQASNTPKNF